MPLLVLVLLLLPSYALADIRTLDALQTFDGSPDPAGPVPWVRASFNDFDKGGGFGPVTLTFEALNLTGAEHVTELYLNLNPIFDPTHLSPGLIEKVGDFESPVAAFGADAFQADGDGRYDIHFAFASSGGPSSLFGVGDSFSLPIGSAFGLPISASSFDFPSTSDGTSGPFYMAARIEGIGPNNASAWIATPEPSSGLLAALALIGFCIIRRRR